LVKLIAKDDLSCFKNKSMTFFTTTHFKTMHSFQIYVAFCTGSPLRCKMFKISGSYWRHKVIWHTYFHVKVPLRINVDIKNIAKVQQIIFSTKEYDTTKNLHFFNKWLLFTLYRYNTFMLDVQFVLILYIVYHIVHT
jgi:hypothetical protein